MPVLITLLWSMLATVAGGLVEKVILSLGVGVVTYTGVSASLTWLKTQAVTASVGLGSDVLGMLSTMKVGTCISIIFSATVARFTLNGLSSDTFKRWVKK